MKYIGSKKKLFLLIILVVFAVVAASFAYYVSDYYPADSKAVAALKSTESYNVTDTANSIAFTPTQNKSTKGIIFYPGGKVQPEAYSVIASKLAANGYTTIIVKMPFNLVFFGVNSADEVIAKHPEITSWVIMGPPLEVFSRLNML